MVNSLDLHLLRKENNSRVALHLCKGSQNLTKFIDGRNRARTNHAFELENSVRNIVIVK